MTEADYPCWGCATTIERCDRDRARGSPACCGACDHRPPAPGVVIVGIGEPCPSCGKPFDGGHLGHMLADPKIQRRLIPGGRP